METLNTRRQTRDFVMLYISLLGYEVERAVETTLATRRGFRIA
jgi:hypothetical protein